MTMDFVAGPVHIDGQQLHFFVELKSSEAPLALLAAAYTVVFMRENAQELAFTAYTTRQARLTEDDWYDIAKEHYDLHLQALKADPAILCDVRAVVEQQYFGSKVPPEVHPFLAQSRKVVQGVQHAA